MQPSQLKPLIKQQQLQKVQASATIRRKLRNGREDKIGMSVYIGISVSQQANDDNQRPAKLGMAQ